MAIARASLPHFCILDMFSGAVSIPGTKFLLVCTAIYNFKYMQLWSIFVSNYIARAVLYVFGCNACGGRGLYSRCYAIITLNASVFNAMRKRI